MAVDMFLKLEGIEGESQDAKHSKEIDLLAWSWGASQSGTTHMGSGGGGGKVNVQDFSFTKYVDSATHSLWQRTFDGGHIKEGILTMRKAGGEQQEYLIVTFTDMIVSSISTGGSGGEDRLTENVTLNFSEVKISYFPQKADGTLEAAKDAGWNIATNETNV